MAMTATSVALDVAVLQCFPRLPLPQVATMSPSPMRHVPVPQGLAASAPRGPRHPPGGYERKGSHPEREVNGEAHARSGGSG